MALQCTSPNNKEAGHPSDTSCQLDESRIIETIDDEVRTGTDHVRGCDARCFGPNANAWSDHYGFCDESLPWLGAERGLPCNFYYSAEPDVCFKQQAALAQGRTFDHEQYSIGSNLVPTPHANSSDTTLSLPTHSSATEETMKYNGGKSKRRRVRKSKKSQPEPNLDRPDHRKSGDIKIGDVNALREFFETRFEVLLVKACKPVGANIINIICPYKTHDYPYCNPTKPENYGGRPHWWPADIKYTSPHHMRKPDPGNYNIIMEKSKEPEDWKSLLDRAVDMEHLRDESDLAGASTTQLREAQRRAAKLRVFREIVDFAGMAAKVAEGAIDADFVAHYGPVPDECFLRSKKGHLLSDNYKKGRVKKPSRDMEDWLGEYNAGEESTSGVSLDGEPCQSSEIIQDVRTKRRRLTFEGHCSAVASFSDSIADDFVPPFLQLSLPESTLNIEDYSVGTGVDELVMQTDQEEVVPLVPMTAGSALWCSASLKQQQQQQLATSVIMDIQSPANHLTCTELRHGGSVPRSLTHSGHMPDEFATDTSQRGAVSQFFRQWPHHTGHFATGIRGQNLHFGPQSHRFSWPASVFAAGYPDTGL